MSEGRRPSRVFHGLPPHGAGQAIGLFGGTFNPPHEGHRNASVMALRRLGLDWVWWLVTPGNPLKQNGNLPRLASRIEAAARVASHPRIVVTGIEQALRTRYTADLIRILKTRSPTTRFVWVMGGDNLVQFHRWEDWRGIAAAVPIAVINRPGSLPAGLAARAAQALAPWRVDVSDASTLAAREPPAWTYVTGPRVAVSSTALRGGGAQPAAGRAG